TPGDERVTTGVGRERQGLRIAAGVADALAAGIAGTFLDGPGAVPLLGVQGDRVPGQALNTVVGPQERKPAAGGRELRLRCRALPVGDTAGRGSAGGRREL